MHLRPYTSPRILFNQTNPLTNPANVLSVVAWIAQIGRAGNTAATDVRTVDSTHVRDGMPNGRQRSVMRLGFSTFFTISLQFNIVVLLIIISTNLLSCYTLNS
jgi:hypothetical protein